jgi:hypothetical protein
MGTSGHGASDFESDSSTRDILLARDSLKRLFGLSVLDD